MLDYFQCRGVLLEQGPAVLAVVVGGSCLDIFFFSALGRMLMHFLFNLFM